MRNSLILVALSVASSVAASTDQVPLGLPDEHGTYDTAELLPEASQQSQKLALYGGLKADECTVNIAETPPKVHDGYTRRGIYFWAYGAVIEDYCIFWEGENFPFFQPTCYFDDERGTHRVDTSWFNDEDAERGFERAKSRSLEWWMDYAGCRSGANEFCWGACT